MRWAGELQLHQWLDGLNMCRTYLLNAVWFVVIYSPLILIGVHFIVVPSLVTIVFII